MEAQNQIRTKKNAIFKFMESIVKDGRMRKYQHPINRGTKKCQ